MTNVCSFCIVALECKVLASASINIVFTLLECGFDEGLIFHDILVRRVIKTPEVNLTYSDINGNLRRITTGKFTK